MSMLWYYPATAAALFQMCDALKSKKQWELQCKYQFHPMKRRVLNGSNSNRRKWRRRNIILQSNDHPLYVQHLQNVSLCQKYYILSSCSHINYLVSLPMWDSCFFLFEFSLGRKEVPTGCRRKQICTQSSDQLLQKTQRPSNNY